MRVGPWSMYPSYYYFICSPPCLRVYGTVVSRGTSVGFSCVALTPVWFCVVSAVAVPPPSVLPCLFGVAGVALGSSAACVLGPLVLGCLVKDLAL